jgi:hypothetical protein
MIQDCLFFYSSMRKKQGRGWINGLPVRVVCECICEVVVFCISLPKTHDLSSTFVFSVVFRSGTSGLVVHCKTLLEASTFNSSTLFFFWLLHLCVLGDITSCSCPWTNLHQGKFKRKRLAQNISNSNVCTPFL